MSALIAVGAVALKWLTSLVEATAIIAPKTPSEWGAEG